MRRKLWDGVESDGKASLFSVSWWVDGWVGGGRDGEGLTVEVPTAKELGEASIVRHGGRIRAGKGAQALDQPRGAKDMGRVPSHETPPIMTHQNAPTGRFSVLFVAVPQGFDDALDVLHQGLELVGVFLFWCMGGWVRVGWVGG